MYILVKSRGEDCIKHGDLWNIFLCRFEEQVDLFLCIVADHGVLVRTCPPGELSCVLKCSFGPRGRWSPVHIGRCPGISPGISHGREVLRQSSMP